MKRLGLILVILVVGVFLTGCCGVCTPPVPSPCTLEITAGYWVWGEVYINGQSTGAWIDFQEIEGYESVTINVPCGETVNVKIVDYCGFESHVEVLYISPGENYLYFAYW